MRLNKYLASLGVASRRGVDKLIEVGAVTVNGKTAKLGQTIDPGKDEVAVKGEPVNKTTDHEYHLVYKPVGYVSSVKDPHNQNTVASLAKSNKRLYPVGRLDQDSEGLVLLTNDGDLTYKFTHPSFHVPKTYDVVLTGQWTDQKLNKLRSGIKLSDGMTSKADVEVLNLRPRRTVIRITLYEGKNRQIRRMASKLKLEVGNLKRIAIGPLKLGELNQGESRQLSKDEVKELVSLFDHA